METPSKNQILAASSGWIATILNFIPGLGAGYLYQRRWVPYFITVGVASAWFIAGAILNSDAEQTKSEQLIGIGGLLLIAIVTMIEAKLAQKNALFAVKEELQTKPLKKSGRLFR